MRNNLSVVIVTLNEEDNIGHCLEYVSWADEIVVLDSGSEDSTIAICEGKGCRVIKTDWLGFGRTKRKAVEAASNDWVLSIDADEEVSPQLKQRILEVLKNPDANGYRIKRISSYLEKRINFCGWNHDYPLRLFNKKRGNFNDRQVHEFVELSGKIGKLREPIYHYPYPSIESHFFKMIRYARLSAQQAVEKGRKATLPGAYLRGIYKFLRMYFFQLGFLDGKTGLLLCFNSAIGVYYKHLLLWEKSH